MVERIPTRIAGLDALIEGGFPKGATVLVSGTPGTGKSIFCAQVLYNNALKGKKCLYLNLEQDTGRLEGQMEDFGWGIKKLEKNLKIVSIDSSDPNMVGYILSEIQKMDYDLIVLDSLDSISSTPIEAEVFGKMGMQKIAESVVPMVLDVPAVGRLKLKKIFTAIAKSGATAFLTSEKVDGAQGLSRDTISEFLCDSIIALHYLGVGSAEYRSLQIRKLRRSGHEKGFVLFEIGKKGIEIKEEKPI